MPLKSLASGAVATGAGTTNYAQNRAGREYGMCQFKLPGGASSVKLQGRLSSHMSWADIVTFTTDGQLERVTLCPEMRAYVSAVDAAAIAAGGVSMELYD